MVMMKKTGATNGGVTPTANPASRLIGNGDAGPEVSALQQQLHDLGFDPGTVDGQFGGKTEAALKKFQASKGLPADGVLGPKTRAVLDAACKAAAPKQDGSQVSNKAANQAADKARRKARSRFRCHSRLMAALRVA